MPVYATWPTSISSSLSSQWDEVEYGMSSGIPLVNIPSQFADRNVWSHSVNYVGANPCGEIILQNSWGEPLTVSHSADPIMQTNYGYIRIKKSKIKCEILKEIE
jgi:hypothetical protein